MKTAIEIAGISPSQLYIHHVCPLPGHIQTLCKEFGVHTRRVEPFDPRYPTNNKIQQHTTNYGDVDYVVLMDADMVFAHPLPLEELHQPVHGKLVDHPNPPLRVLKNIFQAAGLQEPAVETNRHRDSQGKTCCFDTYRGNFNGGFYVIRRSCLPSLGRAWAKWSRWLISHVALLESWTHHIDQIAFCMAMNELNVVSEELDNAWNYPAHTHMDEGDRGPFILHHHLDFSEGFSFQSLPETPRTLKAVKQVTRVMCH